MSSIFASLNELKAQGWTRRSDVRSPDTWPASDSIVVAKDGHHLEHVYSVRTDDSDWPGDDGQVRWSPVEVYAKTEYYTKRLEMSPPVPFDPEEAHRHRMTVLQQRDEAERVRHEAAERAELERLQQKYGSKA